MSTRLTLLGDTSLENENHLNSFFTFAWQETVVILEFDLTAVFTTLVKLLHAS